MDIITGYKGRAHVTAEQDRAVNQGVFGEGSYVLSVGQMMRAEIASNTEIRIYDGVLSHQGCAASIRKNAYDSVTIANGSQGMKRKDLVVARYTRDAGSGVENIEWNVIQGVPSASAPELPLPTPGDIQAGDTVADMAMYEVDLDGINITAIVKLFDVHSFASSAEKVAYDNNQSGLNAENVQGAIDEIAKPVKIERVYYPSRVTIGGGTGTNKEFALPVINGYKPVGVCGWYITGTAASKVTFPNVYITTDNKIFVFFTNTGSNAVTLETTSYFDVVYLKN